MTLKVSAADGVKIYNLSSGRSLPEWVSDKTRRKRSAAPDQSLGLLQDFSFPSACRKVEATSSGDCVVATGSYPPQVRLFDVANLSAKVTRHFDADITDFEILTEDFSKLAFLCADRTVKFHARFGYYHDTRIPFCGRAVRYVPYLAHLLLAGSSSSLHRLDLAEGRFLSPHSTCLESINACDVSDAHGLVCCGGSDGRLECVDVRQAACAGTLDVSLATQKERSELTAVKFDIRGLQLAVGTSDGSVGLFDLRSQKPLLVKDHMYDAPIHSLHYLSSQNRAGADQSNKLASADAFIVKIWDTVTSETYTNIEPGQNAGINHMHWWKDSSLLFLACNDAKIQSYFIPSLGTAPQWCSFLDGITEELEEEAGHVLYDDYRFVTQEMLVDVGLSHLIGTDLLKAYMHGYFVHNKLYAKAQLLHRRRASAEEDLSRNRISAQRRVPQKPSRRRADIQDERFKALYEDPAFQIDEDHAVHNRDSLLVPVDSVRVREELELPFESRTARQKTKGKKRRGAGGMEFDFVPKQRPQRRQGSRRR